MCRNREFGTITVWAFQFPNSLFIVGNQNCIPAENRHNEMAVKGHQSKSERLILAAKGTARVGSHVQRMPYYFNVVTEQQ